MLTFSRLMMPSWESGPHHALLSKYADKFLRREIRFLGISLPPRHTKSEMFSINLPAMILGHYPSADIIHASYAASLSNGFSFRIREMIRSSLLYRELFPATVLHADRQRIDDWRTVQGGMFRSVGVGAGITGQGADWLIIDDPHKEGDEKSMTTLDDMWTWYISAARTRLSKGGSVVLVHTRWSPFDLIGRVEDVMSSSPDADQFVFLRLPALAEKDDVLGRSEGQALWPSRFDERTLKAMQVSSPRYFAALYQQDPKPDETQLFFKQDFKRAVITGGEKARGIWCFDLAITNNESADFTAWARFVRSELTGDKARDMVERTVTVSHIARKRQEWPDTKQNIIDLMLAFPNDIFVFPRQTFELIAVQELRRLGTQYSRRIRQTKMAGDKRANAAPFSDLVRAGRVTVEMGADGDLFINEHCTFPGRNDDLVDVSSVFTSYAMVDGVFSALVTHDDAPEFTAGAITDYWANLFATNAEET